ncbi:hypothetical protein ZWY2020_049088 [Hordeum vulgare]|nr:hypothetical protein ZWY2020_049088 [Hordeum vulgare]
MVVRGHQDLDANIVRWGLHHLLDGDACVHRPQSPTTDNAPPPTQPHRASALLDAPALAEVRVDAVDNDEDFTEKLQHLPQSKMLDLFQKDYIHAVTVGVGLMVLQQFGGVNAMCFYASEIFVSVGFSSGNTGMLAMVAVQIPMTALGVLLMDKAGRRPLLIVKKYTDHKPLLWITLDKTFEERDTLNYNIVKSINEAAETWGLKCLRYEIRDITPPDGVKKAMEMQAAAERKKRAQILKSEGSFY